jgi:hypothetical protein
MWRAGLGLKPVLALYLALVLGLAVLLLGVAAHRLIRHGMLLEFAAARRALLDDLGARLPAACPELQHQRVCPGLAGWAGSLARIHPELEGLAVVDGQGRVLASTAAGDAWDGLAGGEVEWRLGLPAPWELVPRAQGGRALRAEAPLGLPGLRLRASFSLAGLDRQSARAGTSLVVYGLLVAGALLLLGFAGLWWLVVRPLERLLRVVERASQAGDLSWMHDPAWGTELGRLGSGLGRMARRIDQDQARLRAQIEELSRLNAHLEQTQQGLVRTEKLASVGRLAAGLAHEIGNPIAAVLGYVNMLRTEDIPPGEARDMLARVEREVERVDRILRELLAYSRPHQATLGAHRPEELLADALALLRPQKKWKQITCLEELPAGLPAVRADAELLRQVLVNLLMNALDALPTGGHLWVRAASVQREEDGRLGWNGQASEPAFFGLGELHAIHPPRGGAGLGPGARAVVFAVVDDGAGIAAQDLSRVFDPFFTTKEPGRGTGLGLAICHSAVQSMGGEIWAWSRPGLGTQLAFHLPVDPDA